MTAVALAFVLLAGRAAQLQIGQHGRFRELAEGNRVRILFQPAPRGLVYDRRGEVLADNSLSFQLSVFDDWLESEHVRELMQKYLGISRAELGKLRQRPAHGFVTLRRHAAFQTVVKIRENPSMQFVFVTATPRRAYPQGRLASHVLGYIGEIDDKALEARRDQDYRLGDFVGKLGIEASMESWLRGRRGGEQVEVDAEGHVVRVLGRRRPLPGNDVHLTLDGELQRVAELLLAPYVGAVVVLGVEEGDVLALASSPGFQPQVLVPPTAQEDWNRILADPRKPLHNRAMAGLYPPGSTFKLITSLAALQSDKVEVPGAFCPGFYQIGSRRFRCWKRAGHGRVDLLKGLAESCDVLYYQLGLSVGADHLHRLSDAFGLGRRTGVDLLNEAEGTLPSPEWKEKQRGERWYPGDTANFSIGQGYVQTTPVQMAMLTAAFASGGRLVRPRLVGKVVSPSGQVVHRPLPRARHLDVSPEHLRQIREGMRAVVTIGTGKLAAAQIPVAGKTGTSEDPPRKNPHAWFVGYAPHPSAKIALAVVIEEGGSGGEVAAPIARELFVTAHKLGYI